MEKLTKYVKQNEQLNKPYNMTIFSKFATQYNVSKQLTVKHAFW